jgi:hypothetical protein
MCNSCNINEWKDAVVMVALELAKVVIIGKQYWNPTLTTIKIQLWERAFIVATHFIFFKH